MNDELLKGVRVLDFGAFMAGPVAALMLGFMGAEVIKVESLSKYDGARLFVTGVGRPPADPKYGDQFFNASNNTKKSLTLDLKTKKGKELLYELVEHVDIVIENMSPGTMKKLGADFETLSKYNPNIIYISSSACGQFGPQRDNVGYAANFSNRVGVGHLTGYKDEFPSTLVGSMDLRSASMATYAMLTALIYRERTGEGQYVDLASQEAIAAQLGDVYLDCIINGSSPTRDGNHRLGYAPYNAYPCNEPDSWVTIGIATEEEWISLCNVIGDPNLTEDQKFKDYNSRRENQYILDNIISSWTKNYNRYEITEMLQAVGVAAAPALKAKDILEDPHIIARESFSWMDHPTLKQDFLALPPWKFSKTPVSVKRHAPMLGEHNVEILKTILNKTDHEINELKISGAF